MQVGIVAALPGELKPLTRGWARAAGNVWRGSIGEATCYAVAAGMGAAASTRGVDQLFAAAGRLDAVISVGWAGSLTSALRAPTAYIVGEVIESRTGERYRLEPVDTSAGPALVTTPGVIAFTDKPALAARYGATLVDMEAATVARLASARGVRFLCVKGISDNVEDRLPDFNRFTGSDGQLRMPAFMAHVILRPRYWPALKLLGINSKLAAEAIAERVPLCLRGAGLIS